MLDYQTTRVQSEYEQGLYISAVAYNNEFRVGDRIVGLNGVEVATGGQMRELLSDCKVGDVVCVTVQRNGEQMDIYVPLTETDIPENTAEPAA